MKLTKKQYIMKIAAPLAAGIMVSIFLTPLYKGTGPWFLYDRLMKRSSSPAVAEEILLIEIPDSSQFGSRTVIDPRVLTPVLQTLLEMDAGSLVIQAPVLGIAPTHSEGSGIFAGFDDEFVRIEDNVRNLFEGIRAGSVPPQETDAYVGSLVTLIRRSKERLLGRLQGSTDIDFLEQAAGRKVWVAGDRMIYLYPQNLSGESYYNGQGLYSRVEPDRDGVLRRIYPVLYGKGASLEYVTFAALKEYLGVEEVLYSKKGISLKSADGETTLAIDSEGALLPVTHWDDTVEIPTLSFSTILDYERIDRSLSSYLEDMNRQGYFESIDGEKNPVYLYQFASLSRDEYLKQGSAESKDAWLRARNSYLESLEKCFSGELEASIVGSYEKILSNERLSSVEKNQIQGFRDGMESVFSEARGMVEEFLSLREELANAADKAFCILTVSFSQEASPSVNEAELTGLINDREASISLANGVLTGRSIRVAEGWQLGVWTAAWVVISCLLLLKAGPVSVFILGLIAAFCAAAFSSAQFLFNYYWVNPMALLSGIAAVTGVSFLIALVIWYSPAAVARRTCESAVSPRLQKKLAFMRKNSLLGVQESKALIVAIRNEELLDPETRNDAAFAARQCRTFRENAACAMKNAGAAIIGCDGAVMVAAFNSPLTKKRRFPLFKRKPDPIPSWAEFDLPPSAMVEKALQCILSLLEDKTWSVGIDGGNCSFTYTNGAGYSGFGLAVNRARILASLGQKYKEKFLITGRVKKALDAITEEGTETRRLDTIVEKGSDKEEVFYCLLRFSR